MASIATAGTTTAIATGGSKSMAGRYGAPPLFLLLLPANLHQFHIVQKRCIRRNVLGILRSFGEGRRNNQLTALTRAHSGYAFVDARNHLVPA